MDKPYYRQGGKQPRNIYWVTPEHPEGEYVGVFFAEADAAKAVRALNHQLCKSSRRAMVHTDDID